MRPFAFAPLLALAACVGGGRESALAAAQPQFVPERFFAGETVGEGTLKVAFKERIAVAVESTGRLLPDGTFRLRQRIKEGSKPSRVRTWLLRPLGGGRYTGTLTDATGPVEAEAEGNRFHVRYPGDGVDIEQWLYLRPDGRTVDNRLVAKKLGVTVAALEETIRKVG